MAFTETTNVNNSEQQQQQQNSITANNHSQQPSNQIRNAFFLNTTPSSRTTTTTSSSSSMSSSSTTSNRINTSQHQRRRLNSYQNINLNGYRRSTREMEEEITYRMMIEQREGEGFSRARREAHFNLDEQQQQEELLRRRGVIQRELLLQQQQRLRQEEEYRIQARQRIAAAHGQTYIHHHQTPPNPPQPPQPTPRPPIQHRVYLINCKSCGSFLTDRGMKAVLLLRPHITLYSTDAMPNCGALHQPSRLAEPSLPNEPIVERTCDCLTQTLGCFGCGNAVGYHIVSPCSRCTNSVAKHQRSSNGHRTVLHCAEIDVRERRYVPGEPGVLVAPFQPPPPPLPAQQQQSRQRRRMRTPEFVEEEDDEMDEEDEEEEDDEEEDEEDDFVEANDKPPYREENDNGVFTMRNGNLSTSINSNQFRKIKRGDVLFWSDLAPGGERSIPIDSDDHLDQPLAGR